MTRDELIEELESIIFHHELEGDETRDTATVILDTIFGALKEPTREMKTAWDDDMSDWINEDIKDPWHPWVVMLNASPLAPNNKENK